MTRHSFVILVCVQAALAAPAAAAEELQDWFEQIWTSASSRNIKDALYQEWREIDAYQPSADELGSLRQAVNGRADHPDGDRLRRYEAVLAGRPRTVLHRVWMQGGTWRVCWDYIEPRASYFDRAVRDDEAWAMTPESLTQTDPRHSAPVGYNYTADYEPLRQEMLTFATGGLSQLPIAAVPCPKAELVGSAWTARTTVQLRKGPGELLVAGEWDVQRGGTISRVEFVNPWHQRTVYLNTEWNRTDVANRRAAFRQRVEYSDPPAAEMRELVSLRPITRTELATRLTTPTENAVDPVRGRVSFTSIMDLTGSVPKHVGLAIGENGDVVATAPRTPPQFESAEKLRLAGWVVLAGGLTALIAIRTRRLLAQNRVRQEQS